MAKRGRKKKFKVSFNVNPGTLRSIMAVGLLLFSVLALISFAAPDYFINAKIQLILRKAFGHSSIVFPLITAISGLLFIDAFKNRIKDVRIVFGLVALMITIAGFFHLFISSEEAQQIALDGGGGGIVGLTVATTLKSMISVYGAVFVLLALGVIAIILILNVSIDDGIEFFNNYIKTGNIFKFKKRSEDQIEMQEGMSEVGDGEAESVKQPEIPFAKEGDKKEAVKESEFEIIPTISEPATALDGVLVGVGSGLEGIGTGNLPPPDKVWKLPGVDLLEDSSSGPPDTGDVEANKKIITDTLHSFGVSGVRVVDVQVGPTVTKYALDTPPGVRINRVSNLQHDLARSLSSPTGQVRIEAPIAGTALIGIEVPNKVRAIVDFKSLITSEPMKSVKSKLAIVLGTDVGGVTHIYDIGKMPHLLVAGQTGSGKSIFLHNVILSLLYRATPQEVKFIIVDPKRVELKVYEDIPHLYAPLIIEKEQAVAVFSWAVREMIRRFKMFESTRVSNIQAYNEKSGFQAMPYIVIIVDEFTEIMLADPTSLEKHVVRLAQLARATGIHLVLAAQRPQANVITGLIKANIPCRIAFAVAGMHDSRIIIDQQGAEKLLGSGDMLFIPPDKPTPTRLQGAFIKPNERNNVVEFLKSQGFPPDYKEEIFTTPADDGRGKSVAAGGEETDPYYDEAAQIVISAGKGSASLLQRRLSVGYARAARIIDELEKNGIVGPSQGSRAREVLTDTLPDSAAVEDFDEFEDGVVEEEDQKDF